MEPGAWLTKEVANKTHLIEASFLHWMAVHGSLCLAMRHPQYTGSSRELVLEMVETIEVIFLKEGMPKAELDYIHKVEQKETLKLQEGDT